MAKNIEKLSSKINENIKKEAEKVADKIAEKVNPPEQIKLPNTNTNYDLGKVKGTPEPAKPNEEHKQFDRVYCVTVGLQDGTGTIIEGKPHSTGLDMSFDIQKDLTTKANKSTLKFYNLAPKTISFFEGKDALCMVEVGYGDDVGLKRIFIGFVDSVKQNRSGADVETEIHLKDGNLPVRNTVVSLSYKGNVSRKKILEDVANAMGVALEIAKDVDFKDTTLNNYSHIGGPTKVLNDICGGVGLEWSMQNGILQIIKAGGDIGYKGFVLNSHTGLINIPQKIVKESSQNDKNATKKASKKKEKKAGWKIICLLNPTLTPADIIRIESKLVTGWFKIESLHHKGDYSGREWYTEMDVIEIELDKKEEKTEDKKEEKTEDKKEEKQEDKKEKKKATLKEKIDNKIKEMKNKIKEKKKK